MVLMNSDHILRNNIIKFSLVKILNIVCINIILLWVIDIIHYHNINKKIDVYVIRNVDMNIKYTANEIHELYIWTVWSYPDWTIYSIFVWNVYWMLFHSLTVNMSSNFVYYNTGKFSNNMIFLGFLINSWNP